MQLRAADHLRQRLALAAPRPHPEHRPRALVHEHDALVPVHRDHALHHAVQDRRGLGALLLRVVDLLAQPRHHDVERAAQRAQLVHRTDGGPRAGLALAHTPGDLLHLDDGTRDPAGDEDADAGRHRQRQQAAREHHAVQLCVRGRHDGQRQRQAQHADRARAVAHRHRGVEERRADGRARAEVAAHAAGERGADLGPVAVILQARKLRGGHLGVTEHESVERDEGHARARRLCRAHRERPDRRRRRGPDEEGTGVVVQEPGGGDQPGLERVHGEGLQRVVQIDAGRHHAQRDEADEREGQLDGDAAAHERQRPGHRRHHSPSGAASREAIG